MDSAFGAEAVHVRFCIFTGHNEASELLVGDLILPYLMAACAVVDNQRNFIVSFAYRKAECSILQG